MYKRWYDADPVISAAVNLFENGDSESKKYIAQLILKEATDMGIVLNKDKFDCFWHRKLDDNVQFQNALEYLKSMDFEARKEISFKIIKYINRKK